MTITDPRQPVYIRKGKRYVPVGNLNDPYKYESFHSTGLWLHIRTKYSHAMTKIANIEDLPCSAVAFAAVMQHHEELRSLLTDNQNKSKNDIATAILEWIATKANQ